jgi:hypothetical protein
MHINSAYFDVRAHEEILPYILDLVSDLSLVILKNESSEVQQKTNKAIDGILIKYARISKTDGRMFYTSRFPISKEFIEIIDAM